MNIFNLFKYEKTFDASENIKKFEHKILKYIWFFPDGKVIESDEPIIKHYFSKKGSFYVSLGIILECGDKNNNCCYECRKQRPTFTIK